MIIPENLLQEEMVNSEQWYYDMEMLSALLCHDKFPS